ncbi:hypothetical protein FNJ84_11070 [Paracoccus sp. M683]|uniref:hypothetical protein n=1 Tax=Paracoccus sp. M683 TaxID=2594268 RepID=UPI00117C9393|nr:hypothetical protein [Paracoccus sp. M683]TRW96620.1 hypothetical protein FNJ84_11070 [Paracoccus sp. M683]
MTWLARHAQSIQAGSAILTAIVALAALIGVKVQLDQADRVQREQSAREAYRAHLSLAASMPDFAQPQDACRLLVSGQGGAYVAFVDHLLYSAEQMLAISEGWQRSFLDELAVHRDYLCMAEGPAGETEEMHALLSQFRNTACPTDPICG